MKKLFLTIIGVIFMTTIFSQSFIGDTKKVVLSTIKSSALEISKPVKMPDVGEGYYSIKVKYTGGLGLYSFTKQNLCYFYVIAEQYSDEKFGSYIINNDDRYKRAFDDKKTIWREWMGSTFVYRGILVNYNTGIIYYIFLTKENYENNRDNYLKDFLGTTH